MAHRRAGRLVPGDADVDGVVEEEEPADLRTMRRRTFRL
jgi:hypothetical protein